MEFLKNVKSKNETEKKPPPKKLPSSIAVKTESQCSFCNMVFFDFRQQFEHEAKEHLGEIDDAPSGGEEDVDKGNMFI